MDFSSSESRRSFLKRAAALGLLGTAVAPLAGCGGGESSSSSGGGSAATASACDDVSGLTEAELNQRQTMAESLNYVTESPIEGQLCNNCQLYVQPTGGSACGGCTLFPGPVAPEGYCTSWVAASA